MINIIESHSSITNRLLLKNELHTLAKLRLAYLKIEEDTDLKQNLHKMIINVIIYPFLMYFCLHERDDIGIWNQRSYLNELTSKFRPEQMFVCVKGIRRKSFCNIFDRFNTYIRFPLMLHALRKAYN